LSVTAARPDPHFVPAVIQLVQEAPSWRSGEKVGRLLVQYAPFLTVDTLRAALDAWCDNDQCRRAADMTNLAVAPFHGTAHLGTARSEVFATFLTNVQALEGEDDYYSYPALKEALATAGYSPST
jgi:hypothetical protein